MWHASFKGMTASRLETGSMSAVIMRVLAAVLLITMAIVSSAAAPAKRWFLTVNGWSHSNASFTPGGKTTIHWGESFKTRDECQARLRTIQKCPGLIAEQVGGFGVAKITGHCQYQQEQPKPALTLTPEHRELLRECQKSKPVP